MSDTIFALASAQGRAGVSVVRISGPEALNIARDMCGVLPDIGTFGVRPVVAPDGAQIDTALVLTFAGPRSFTGEDTAELHLHGSVAVVRAVLETLSAADGARMAEAGEFTRRALENGKLDLAQVEGLAELIDAETEAQRRQALRVLSGELGQKVEIWRTKLIRSAALIEATIDFADEDVPVDVTPEVNALLKDVVFDLQREIDGSFVAERIRSGFEVAIVGAPNVGKSTLLNALAGRDAAITSEIAGTTRDIIEVRMDLGGLPVTLLDTAGLRNSEDTVESIGIARALSRAATADIRVVLKRPEDDLALDMFDGDITLRPKIDAPDGIVDGISGLTGHGIPELLSRLKSTLLDRSASAGLATHERHRSAMVNAVRYILAARNILTLGPDEYDIAAEEIRFAIRSLEALIGRIDVENLLDEIFSSFCVGK